MPPRKCDVCRHTVQLHKVIATPLTTTLCRCADPHSDSVNARATHGAHSPPGVTACTVSDAASPNECPPQRSTALHGGFHMVEVSQQPLEWHCPSLGPVTGVLAPSHLGRSSTLRPWGGDRDTTVASWEPHLEQTWVGDLPQQSAPCTWALRWCPRKTR
jgi:hypothetical protein